ncbi:MoxR family ATPase [Brucella abortus]|nr:MoxR family ATPase [Brucella abortus]
MSVAVTPETANPEQIVAEAERALADIARIRESIGTVIFGQEKVIERTLVAVLAGGHALLVGVPGPAKTKLVETLGTVLGLSGQRIQFTPDLMPSGHYRLGSHGAGRRWAPRLPLSPRGRFLRSF